MAGKNNERTDVESAYFIAVALAILVIWLIWTYARNFIVWFMFSFDIAQFYAIRLAFGFSETANGFLEFMKGTYRSPDHPLYVDPFSVTFDEMMTMSKLAGNYFRWLLVPAMLGMVVHVALKMKGGGLSRGFSLTGKFGPSLADYQAQHWRVFTIGAKFDPDDQSNKLEAPSTTPMEWMRDNNIRLSDEIDGLDFEAARLVFETQLGERWPGLTNTPVHIKALCVIFFYNAKRDKNSRKIKEQVSVIYATKDAEKRDQEILAIFNKAMEDPKFSEVIEKYARKHAYTNTSMYRLLTWARDLGGVLASAEFRWLKAIDRTLWYGLNNCGRRSYHIEGAGIVSHYNAEKIIRSPIVEAHVDEAVEGLEDYLDHQGLIELDDFFNRNENDF